MMKEYIGIKSKNLIDLNNYLSYIYRAVYNDYMTYEEFHDSINIDFYNGQWLIYFKLIKTNNRIALGSNKVIDKLKYVISYLLNKFDCAVLDSIPLLYASKIYGVDIDIYSVDYK